VRSLALSHRSRTFSHYDREETEKGLKLEKQKNESQTISRIEVWGIEMGMNPKI